MSARINELFADYDVGVYVHALALSAHQRDLVRRDVAKGTAAVLRYRCLIAEAANEAFDDIDIGGYRFVLNPKAKSQFGKNHGGEVFLTTGVIDTKTNIRYRLTWRGENVPHKMLELAVAHDEGRNVRGCVIPLPLGDAEVHILGEKYGRKHDDRPNHDTAKNGKPYPRAPRRHHNRVCAADL